MQARTAARELTLILFSQCRKNIDKLDEKTYSDILLRSMRTLTNNAMSNLKISIGSIFEIRDFVETYEAEHPTNLSRPIESNNIEVPLPMTLDMKEKLDDLLTVSENAIVALEMAELAILEEKEDVKSFILNLVKTYKENREQIDGYIKNFAKGWNVERMVRMDKDILKIAISEMMSENKTPMKVIIDEAVELAKKYSTEESSSFINGILASVLNELQMN